MELVDDTAPLTDGGDDPFGEAHQQMLQRIRRASLARGDKDMKPIPSSPRGLGVVASVSTTSSAAIDRSPSAEARPATRLPDTSGQETASATASPLRTDEGLAHVRHDDAEWPAKWAPLVATLPSPPRQPIPEDSIPSPPSPTPLSGDDRPFPRETAALSGDRSERAAAGLEGGLQNSPRREEIHRSETLASAQRDDGRTRSDDARPTLLIALKETPDVGSPIPLRESRRMTVSGAMRPLLRRSLSSASPPAAERSYRRCGPLQTAAEVEAACGHEAPPPRGRSAVDSIETAAQNADRECIPVGERHEAAVLLEKLKALDLKEESVASREALLLANLAGLERIKAEARDLISAAEREAARVEALRRRQHRATAELRSLAQRLAVLCQASDHRLLSTIRDLDGYVESRLTPMTSPPPSPPSGTGDAVSPPRLHRRLTAELCISSALIFFGITLLWSQFAACHR